MQAVNRQPLAAERANSEQKGSSSVQSNKHPILDLRLQQKCREEMMKKNEPWAHTKIYINISIGENQTQLACKIR